MVKFVKRKSNVYKKKGKRSTMTVASVKKIIRSVNSVEEKRFDSSTQSLTIGQVYGSSNTTGLLGIDITPIPTVGTGITNRIGSKVLATKFQARFQFWQQSANTHPMRFIIDVFKVIGLAPGLTTFAQDYYSINPCNGIIDYNSLDDPDYSGLGKRIFRKRYSISPQFSSQTFIKDIVINHKLNHKVQFDAGSTTLTSGAVFVIIRADSGNNATTVSTLANIPILIANSGLVSNMVCKTFYTDE